MSFARILLLATLAIPLAWPQCSSITDLGQDADLVVYASVGRVTGVSENQSLVTLRVTSVLKGALPTAPIELRVLDSRSGFGGGGRGKPRLRQNAEGQAGLWFLKHHGDGWEVQPRGAMDYFLPQPPSAASSLLDWQIDWYRSLPAPSREWDSCLIASFHPINPGGPNRQELLTALAPLIDSKDPAQHAVGLIIGLQIDSVDAIARVADEISVLRTNARFRDIVFAIGAYPATGKKDPAWIGPLRKIRAVSADIQGMDAALAGALYRIGTLESWPLVASILSSTDANAQLIAARTLAYQVPRPEGVKFPEISGNSSPPAREFIEFWKTWWANNSSWVLSMGLASPGPQ